MQAITALRGPLLAASSIFTMVLAACRGDVPPAAAPVPKVSVFTVHPGAVAVTTELPGRTSPYLVAQVRARVDGIVQSRNFIEGADLSAGQRLYQIDPRPYQAALDSAQAALQKALANLATTTVQAERYKVLAAASAVSKQDYDNAVAAQEEAAADVSAGKAAVALAQINLDYTNVAAPISGRIGPALVTQGAYVQASTATLMATIQSLDPIYVDLSQASVEGLRLRRDAASGRLRLNGPHQAKVRLILEDGSTYSHTGTLQFSDISVDQTTGSVVVRALFPNPRGVLLPGMYVRARIDEGSDDKSLLVPEVGVTHDANGQATAMVLGLDNKVDLRSLRLEGTSGDRWVVQDGLKDGDRVIVSGLQRIHQGELVEAVEDTAPTAATAGRSDPQGTLRSVDVPAVVAAAN